jgi:hypothetical protein
MKIRITNNHGSYAEIFENGNLIAHSEQMGWSIELDNNEDLNEELSEEYPGAEIEDLR